MNITELLQQPLIVKYFWIDCQKGLEAWRDAEIAKQILYAQFKPLEIGDKYLKITDGKIEEKVWEGGDYFSPCCRFKLHDKFQPRRECECLCHLPQGWQSSCPNCREAHSTKPSLSDEAVEKKIAEVLSLSLFKPNGQFHHRLLELVKLARQ